MQANNYTFNRDQNFFYAAGPEQPYQGYQVPQYQGPTYPNLGYAVQRGTISLDIHQYTLKLLDQAGAVATAITRPVANPNSSSPSILSSYSKGRRSRGSTTYIDFSHRETNIFSPKTTTVVNNGGGTSKKDDSLGRIIAAIVGLIALAGGAWLMGKSQSKNENLDKEITKFEKQVNLWDYHRPAYAYSPEFEKRVNMIVELTRGIQARNKSSILSTIFKVALPILIAGGSLFGGALLGGTLGTGLIVFGACVLVGAGAYAIYKAVRESTSNTDSDAAQKILRNIDTVQKNTFYTYSCQCFGQTMSFVPYEVI